MKTSKVSSYLLLIGLAIAISLLLWPSFMDAFNSITQRSIIGSYDDAITEKEADELRKMQAAAEAYNKKIYEQQQKRSFSYSGWPTTDDKEYLHTLVASEGDMTMGSIEIPSINIYLPITHGTDSEDLKYQIGHMCGTSLINGGESTHAVIAGHTGLKECNLFTDIVKLKENDEFRIHVLGEIHRYRVCMINVCYPEEEDQFLQIEKGRDLITLYTCTPYGVNDHRLLITGERVMPDVMTENKTVGEQITGTATRAAILQTCLIAAIPLLILIIGSVYISKKAKKTK